MQRTLHRPARLIALGLVLAMHGATRASRAASPTWQAPLPAGETWPGFERARLEQTLILAERSAQLLHDLHEQAGRR
jgi:hypothetical protein